MPPPVVPIPSLLARPSSAPVPKPSALKRVLVYLGPVLGIVGSFTLLYFTLMPTNEQTRLLTIIGNSLMSIAPLMTLPSFVRSAWVQHQPTWVFGGLACFGVWIEFLFSQESTMGKAILITMAGLAFSGLSNMVHPKRPHVVLSPLLSWYCWKNPLFLVSFLCKTLVFMLNDIRQLFVFGYVVLAEWCRLPFNIVQSLLVRRWLPTMALKAFSPSNLWMSRRLGGVLFVLSGVLLLLHELIPLFDNHPTMLCFRGLNGLGAVVINYSLFFTGLFGKHWSDKFLLPGCILATIGSCFFDTTWGFALNQLGVRMNELYFVTLQFRPPVVDAREAATMKRTIDDSHDDFNLLY